MDTIYPFLLPYGKFILITGLLISFYYLLYKKNASYNHSRFYLLALPFFALIMSCFTIEVYTPPAHIVEVEAMGSYHNQRQTTNPQTKIPLKESKDATEEGGSNLPVIREKTLSPSAVETILLKINWEKTLLIIYLSVTGFLLFYPLFGIIHILYIKKQGKPFTYKELKVIQSSKIQTPFSFYTTIYINSTLRESQSRLILAHERWHILHKHYIDVSIIEIITRLLWFNPLLWWVRHELRNIHEYQTDRSVLNHGQDLYEYQTTLLEEVMNNSCCLANGFNHSFIKQRFITMKSEQHVRFSTLRKFLVIPFLLFLFITFTFTEKEAKVIYITKTPIPKLAPITQSTPRELEIKSRISPKKETLIEEPTSSKVESSAISQTKSFQNTPSFPIKSTEKETSSPTTETIAPQGTAYSLKNIKEESLTQADQLNLNKITQDPSDYPQFSNVVLSSVPFNNDIAECPIYIEKNKHETLVTRIFSVNTDWLCLGFCDKNKIMLIDCEAGDRYMLREIKGGYPCGRPFYIRHHKGQMIEITFSFPPLPSSVKTIDIIDGTNVYGLKIKEHLRKRVKVIR